MSGFRFLDEESAVSGGDALMEWGKVAEKEIDLNRIFMGHDLFELIPPSA